MKNQQKQTKKQRERVNTTKCLHQPTKVDSVAEVQIASKSSLRIRPGKGNIWNPTSTIDTAIIDFAVGKPLTNWCEDDVDCALAVEEFRANRIRFLRKKFLDLCKPFDQVAPIYAWERWQARCKLHETINDKDKANGNAKDTCCRDPFLPSDKYLDGGLLEDLKRSSFSLDASTTIASQLAELSGICVAEIKDFVTTFERLKGNGLNDKLCVKVVEHKHTMDISLERKHVKPYKGKNNKNSKNNGGDNDNGKDVGNEYGSGDSKRFFKLNYAHYRKLKALYISSISSADKLNPDISANVSSQRGNDSVNGDSVHSNDGFDTEVFHKRLFVILSRYHSLLGHGFQAALNEHSFDVLLKRFEVSFECFASPLNCTFKRFCCAFPDTDRFFGGVSSFFSFRPASGSFEANPPFVPEVMVEMVHHIHSLLGAATGPMSFVVIVPGWEEDIAWNLLMNSEYKKQLWLVSVKDHGFCDGAQHQRQDRYRESPYDTGVYILQNEAGAVKWPASEAVEIELRIAMSKAIPTDAMIQRRMRDGRGMADLDGGGGVYKGSNKNKRGRDDSQNSNSSTASRCKKKKASSNKKKFNKKRT